MIILDRCFDLAVHHDATKGVVMLEYASEGHVVGTGRRYANRYLRADAPRGRGRALAGLPRLGRCIRRARLAATDLPPAMLVMRHGEQGNAAGLSRKSTEYK